MEKGGHIIVEQDLEEILIEEKQIDTPVISAKRDLKVLETEELKPDKTSQLLGKRDLINFKKVPVVSSGQWSDSDSEKAEILSKLRQEDTVKTANRRRDKYDIEYDQGKQKKIRNKSSFKDIGGDFQKAYDHKKSGSHLKKPHGAKKGFGGKAGKSFKRGGYKENKKRKIY